MDDDDRNRLTDILDFVQELADTLEGVRLDAFRADRGKQRIAERLLEISGEAANHLSPDVLEAIDADWDGLRGLRIILAHAYHRVEADRLWAAATQALPALGTAVKRHLKHSMGRPPR